MTKPLLASFLILVLLAVSGTFLTLYVTPQGMGLFDDSIAYIAGARSILAGQGYREAWLASNQPVTHFPPGFSTVLALVGISGLDPLRGTRFINVILFGANIFLLGLIGWRMTKSKVAGIILAALLLVNGQLFHVHTMAMSEPLYIFFTLAAFLTFSKYLSPSPNEAGARSEGFLLLTAILTAFAYLTRYAGLALFATFLVSLFILYPTWRKRLTSAGVFLAGFIPFALAWTIRNRLLTANATNRTLVYHPITAENIQLGISNFAAFILPIEEWRKVLIKIPNLFAIVLAVIVLALLMWIVFKGLKKFFKPAAETPEVLSFISTLYIFAYLASIISSMSLFDASTKFQLRIVAPMYVNLLIVSVYFGYWLWQKNATSSRFTFYAVRITFFILVVYAFTSSVFNFANTLAQLRKGGQGYASFQWFDSEAMKFLQTLPSDTRIYSNETAPVYLYTDHPGYVLPDLIDPVTGLPRGRFDEGVANLQADVLSGNAVLALFDVDSQDEDVQSVYRTLTDGLYLAFNKQGDKIYTAYP